MIYLSIYLPPPPPYSMLLLFSVSALIEHVYPVIYRGFFSSFKLTEEKHHNQLIQEPALPIMNGTEFSVTFSLHLVWPHWAQFITHRKKKEKVTQL